MSEEPRSGVITPTDDFVILGGPSVFYPFLLTITNLGEEPHPALVIHGSGDTPPDPRCTLAVYPDGRILHFGRAVEGDEVGTALRMVAAELRALYPEQCTPRAIE